MNVLIIPPKYGVELQKKHFTHPFKDYTHRIKRSLLAIAGLSIILKVYDLDIKKIPWLNIEIPLNAPNLLEGVLSVILWYHFIAFILNAFFDIQVWSLNKDKDNLNHIWQNVKSIFHTFEDVKKYINNDSASINYIEKLNSDLSIVDTDLKKYFKSMRYKNHIFISISWIRLFALDIFLPIFLSVVGLLKIGSSSIDLIKLIF